MHNIRNVISSQSQITQQVPTSLLRCYDIDIDCINDIDSDLLQYSLSNSIKTPLILASNQPKLMSTNSFVGNQRASSLCNKTETYFQHLSKFHSLTLPHCNVNNMPSNDSYSQSVKSFANSTVQKSLSSLSKNKCVKEQIKSSNMHKYDSSSIEFFNKFNAKNFSNVQSLLENKVELSNTAIPIYRRSIEMNYIDDDSNINSNFSHEFTNQQQFSQSNFQNKDYSNQPNFLYLNKKSKTQSYNYKQNNNAANEKQSFNNKKKNSQQINFEKLKPFNLQNIFYQFINNNNNPRSCISSLKTFHHSNTHYSNNYKSTQNNTEKVLLSKKNIRHERKKILKLNAIPLNNTLRLNVSKENIQKYNNLNKTNENDNCYDDMGIDSSGSTVSLLDSRTDRKPLTRNSSTFLLSISTSNSDITDISQNKKFFKINFEKNKLNEKRSAHQEFSYNPSTKANAIRRKLLAHSKVKNKRTSAILDTYFDHKFVCKKNDLKCNNQFLNSNNNLSHQIITKQTLINQNNDINKYCKLDEDLKESNYLDDELDGYNSDSDLFR